VRELSPRKSSVISETRNKDCTAAVEDDRVQSQALWISEMVDAGIWFAALNASL